MPSAIVPLADGCEEIESVTIIDVLRRAGVEVTVAGVDGLDVKASRGVNLRADAMLPDVVDRDYDLVALPGGKAGAERLRDDERVQALLERQNEAGRLVAAICAGPIALDRAGMLEGRSATSYPGFLGPEDVDYSEDAVVVDGNVVTSRGPATAMAFALTLVGKLCGKQTRDEHAERLLWSRYPQELSPDQTTVANSAV